jgi:mRNA interferase MazF
MIKHQIVLVPFPFDDFSGTKVRPAICLTDEIGSYKHVVIAFISSQIPAFLESTELLLEKRESDFRMTGLLVDSVIKLHRVVTIPRSLIKRQSGHLPPKLASDVEDRLRKLFGL